MWWTTYSPLIQTTPTSSFLAQAFGACRDPWLSTHFDNCAWLEVVNSKVYTALPGGPRRMSLSGNAGSYLAVAFTGYFDAGDIVALKVYTTVSNFLKATNAGPGLTVTLLQRTAPLVPATPLPPPVIVS